MTPDEKPPTGGIDDGEGLRDLAEAETAEAQAILIAAEYTALRDEIGRYQDHQRQIINSVFLVIGASVTLAGAFGSDGGRVPLATAPKLLLFVPPVYALLALLYLDRAVRIIRLAHYIHHHARPLAARVGKIRLWEWETYKDETRVISRRVAFLLDKLRWSVFILPLAVTALLNTVWLSHVSPGYRVTAGLIGGVSLLVTIGAALLTEETSGVRRLGGKK